MPNTLLTSVNAGLTSYFNNSSDEIEITVISSTLDVDTVANNGAPAKVKFDIILDLPVNVQMDFPQGQPKSINYTYDQAKSLLNFELPLIADQRTSRMAHRMSIDFILQQSYGIHLLSFSDAGDPNKTRKKAVSADPTKWPIIGSDVTECFSNDLGPEILDANAAKSANVFNDWDIYVESNHYHAQGQNGTKVFLNLIIDIPAGGVFNGLTSCKWDATRNCIDFVFDRSLNGGASTSALASFSIQAEANGADPEDVFYYSFKFDREPKRKKVISADPTNRPR